MAVPATESRELVDAVLAGSPDSILVTDHDGRVVVANPAAQALFGYTADELVGLPIDELVPVEARASHSKQRAHFVRAGVPRRMGSLARLEALARDGRRIPVDVSLNPVRVGAEDFVIAYVRETLPRGRMLRQIEAANEITEHLLGGSPLTEVLTLVAARARWLTEGVAAWVVTPTRKGPLVITAVDGPGTEIFLGVELSATESRSARAMARRVPELIDDLSVAANVPPQAAVLRLGPGLYVPMVSADRSVGTLIIARPKGAHAFADFDVMLSVAFAGAAATAITLVEARTELEQRRVTAELERIAMDLHDRVIQRVFGIGMSLEGVRGSVGGAVGDRIGAAVDGLDEVIQELRQSIFRLSQPMLPERSLRGKLLALGERYAGQLGFAPAVKLRGPIDVMVSDDASAELVAICEEALSNVALHAQATQAHVLVAMDEGDIVLEIGDNGIGVPPGTEARGGLRSMATRAEKLGGSCTAELGHPRGTVIRCRVPADLQSG